MRILLVSAVLLGLLTTAAAQDASKAEIFGGYSYGSFPILSSRTSLNGWNASATVNIYPWFGLTTDFGGLYRGSGMETTTISPIGTETEQLRENFQTFMFGPQFAYRRGKLVPFCAFARGRDSYQRGPENHMYLQRVYRRQPAPIPLDF